MPTVQEVHEEDVSVYDVGLGCPAVSGWKEDGFKVLTFFFLFLP